MRNKRKEGQRYIFTVKGRGRFPYDMLRYDCCYPLSERYDSSALENNAREPYGIQGVWTVTLCTTHMHSPTPARWASFNWECYPGETDREGM